MLELLMVGALVGLVFVGVANMYTASLKQAVTLRENLINMDPKATIEAMAKTVVVANAFQLRNMDDGLWRGLWIRVDHTVDAAGALTPRNTPANIADDTWIKYRFLNTDALRWRSDPVGSATENNNVTNGNTLLIPNIHYDGGNPRCEFLSLLTGDPVQDRIVGIRLVTQPGGASTRQEVYTEVALTAKPSR